LASDPKFKAQMATTVSVQQMSQDYRAKMKGSSQSTELVYIQGHIAEKAASYLKKDHKLTKTSIKIEK